ncbi:uncharacterized protein Z518_08498 [Rhinocladiella mackenziei CBS 650.93]|uniref:Uncharacterized protein n=1 Tax=Rhinocladiella mackenziei CBS 650.93 TaxID=1442369 RepID=A0A0D2FKV6_9EURO|nr:uncharacterized protein Z518_08498 [Rhinocladiella mackenziei CBS 650.93]KIX02557.1 hypothetical protein Z518_08498 [Rhinocladiella mackenziei CBS 650.93]
MGLTIGEIAGVINVGVVLLQFTFPLLLVYILAGIVPERSNAITWQECPVQSQSVTGRFLNGSWWPTILRTDGAAMSKVSNRVIFISTFSTLGFALLAVAAVLTPLGLHNTITATSVQASEFVYARDVSPIGQATLPRDDYNTSRTCGWLMWTSCPGQYHGFYTTTNESGAYLNWDSDDAYISTVVPENLTTLFSTGHEGDRATVATPFDIEFRSYTLVSDVEEQESVLLNSSSPDFKIDHYAKRTQGEIQYGDMIVLADDFVIRDGVVADMKKGGLGFRNHTIPRNVHSGADWTEALLWLEPETECVNNNLTVEFGIPEDAGYQETYLVDYGGITERLTDYPYIDLNQTQVRPELYARAHKGAVLMNFNLRQQLNVSTNNASYYGKKFLLPSSYYTPGVVSIGTFDSGIPDTYLSTDPEQNITLVESIGLVTSGYGGMDQANFSHIANIGGTVLGAFSNIDKSNHNGRFDPGTNYSAPLFSCSTSVRVFIMNVTFFMNGTSSLENLQIRSTTPQTYSSNATTPLWAVENTGGMNISDVQPIWGLVGDEYEHDPRLWTIRREYMYLPAGSSAMGLGMLSTSDSLGCGGPINTLDILYNGLDSGGQQFPDFSGITSLPLRQKWQKLSQTKEGIATMMALIWTDITANYVTSSRSQLNSKFNSVSTYIQRKEQNIPSSSPVEVLTYGLVIRYHIPYAIVAIVFLAVYLVVVVAALVMCITQKSTLHLLKSLLNQTSVGRAVVNERCKYQGSRAMQTKYMSTSEWIRDHGSEDIAIIKERKRGQRRRKDSGPGIAQEYLPVEGQGEGSPNLHGKR